MRASDPQWFHWRILMNPRLVDQVLQLVLPVALILVALHMGAHVTGFGKNVVKRLTEKVVHGLLVLGCIWFLITCLCTLLSR